MRCAASGSRLALRPARLPIRSAWLLPGTAGRPWQLYRLLLQSRRASAAGLHGRSTTGRGEASREIAVTTHTRHDEAQSRRTQRIRPMRNRAA
jgi:hypothetical protein